MDILLKLILAAAIVIIVLLASIASNLNNHIVDTLRSQREYGELLYAELEAFRKDYRRANRMD